MRRFNGLRKLMISVQSIAVLTAASLFLTAFHPLCEYADLSEKTGNKPKIEGEYIPGEAIICIDEGVADEKKIAKRAAGLFSAPPDLSSSSLMDVSEAAADKYGSGGASVKSGKKGKTVLKHLKSDTLSTEELIDMYSGKEGVLFAQPNYIHRIEDNIEEPAILTSGTNSDTPDFTNLQYMFNDGAGGVDVPDWNKPEKKNSEGVVIAVIDTGVDYNHEDLSEVMWDKGLEYDELTELGGGKYGINTAWDEYYGENDPDPKPSDPMDVTNVAHGTHCAGIIAAAWNGRGVSGAANGAKIMAVRVSMNDEAALSDLGIIRGFNYIVKAKELNVNVAAVNMSFGAHFIDYSWALSVAEAGKKGIVCSMAASNDGVNNDLSNMNASVMMNIPEEITVGAGDSNGLPCDFSNYGIRTTHIFAPGFNSLSTVAGHFNSVIGDRNVSRPVTDINGRELYDDFSGPSEVFSIEENTANGIRAERSGGFMKFSNIELSETDDVTLEATGNDDFGAVLFTLSANAPVKKPADGKRFSIIIKAKALNKGSWRLLLYSKDKDGGWVRMSAKSTALISSDYKWGVYTFDDTDNIDFDDLTVRAFVSSKVNDTFDGFSVDELWVSDEEYNYTALMGTSMAAPVVTGETAILAARYPEDSAAKRAARVLAGARDSESFKDISITGGMANVRNSLDETKYTPVVNGISISDKGLLIEGFFFGNKKENLEVEICQRGRKWTSSDGSLSILDLGSINKDGESILIKTPEDLKSNREVKVTVTDRGKVKDRQSFCRILMIEDPLLLLKADENYSLMQLNDSVYDVLNNVRLYDAQTLNGDIVFCGFNDLDSGEYLYTYKNGDFIKSEDAITFGGRMATFQGMVINSKEEDGKKLVFYDEGKIVKKLALTSADKETEEIRSGDFLDLYYDGRDLLIFKRTYYDEEAGEYYLKETTVYKVDPFTGIYTYLGSLNACFNCNMCDESGVIISHEEKEGEPNTIYVAGYAFNDEYDDEFTLVKFRAEKDFTPEFVKDPVPEDFCPGELDVAERENTVLSGCGVRNGIYLTGSFEVENDGGIDYIIADNYFFDYAHPEEGFKPCKKKIYDTRMYHIIAAAGYGKVYFFGMTKDGYVLSYTDADTLPNYGDREKTEDKAVQNADGSWNYNSTQKAALSFMQRSVEKTAIEGTGAELEMSLFAKEALTFTGDKKALADSILDKEKSVIKVNGTEVKIKKVVLKNPKKAYVSENSIFKETISELNQAAYAKFTDKKKPGYYITLDTAGLSGDIKKAVKKANKQLKKKPVPIEILPLNLTSGNIRVEKINEKKKEVKKAFFTDENGKSTKLRSNQSGKKDIMSEAAGDIITITGTNNYNGSVKYDPAAGAVTPVF